MMKIEMLLIISVILNFVMFFGIWFMVKVIMNLQKNTIKPLEEKTINKVKIISILNDLFEVVEMHEKDLKVIKDNISINKKGTVKKERAK